MANAIMQFMLMITKQLRKFFFSTPVHFTINYQRDLQFNLKDTPVCFFVNEMFC